MGNIQDLFNSKFNEYSAQLGLTGTDLSKSRKDFQNEEDENEVRLTSIDYLKDGVKLTQIYTLAKNKKLSNNKIKQEIKKLLKDPEELYDFLKSFVKKDDTKKEENKEATGTGGGYGYETLFSGEEPQKVETKEATGSSSSGSYESPSFLAKSMSKKNWRGRAKTQLPGGKFVQVKKNVRNSLIVIRETSKPLTFLKMKL